VAVRDPAQPATADARIGHGMRLLLDFTRAHPWHSLLMLACLLVAAAAEAVAFSTLLPLVSALAGPIEAGAGLAPEPDGLEASAIAGLQWLGLEPTLGTLLLVVPAGFALRGVLILLARREIGYTVARVARELRLRLIRSLLATSWSYLIAQRVGSFANAYATETTRAARGYLHATWVVMLGLQVIVYVSIAFAISWKVTLYATGIGVVVVAVLGPLVRIGRKSGVKQTKLFRSVLGSLTDVLQGVKPLKVMAREDCVGPLLEEGTRALERATRRQILSREAIAALQEPIVAAMLCLGLFTMLRSGLNIASMSVMTMAVWRALDALNRAQRRYQRVAVQESAYRALMQTIVEAERAKESWHGGAKARLEHAIELRSVTFGYGEVPLFEDFSLEIPAGLITALSGPSGAGKTSVVDLVVGLVKPQAGEVVLDGISLEDVDLADWRAHIGYVPQEMFLLHDTVAMNVGLGDPAVSRDQIVQALKDAHAWAFVSKMSDGLDTVVGERGLALSGGQRQRIVIARAILKRPRLLILDEATAALDPKSEAAIWDAIKELRGKTTVLAISHQPALLEVADRIYALEASSVSENSVAELLGSLGESMVDKGSAEDPGGQGSLRSR
jgi:ATP-binding cassette subfamily C protein